MDFVSSPSVLKLTGWWRDVPDREDNCLLNTPLDVFLKNLPPQEAWPFEDATLPSDGGRNLARAIRRGTLCICADGSFLKSLELGTASFQLVDRQTNDRWKGSFRTPGLPRFQSAYRSELSGVTAGSMAASFLMEKFGIERGEIRIGCDSDTALNHSVDVSYLISATTKHHDLLRITHHNIHKHPSVTWTRTFVKGHADDDPTRPLSYMEQLNVECDRMAKERLSTLAGGSHPPYDPQLRHSGWLLMCEGWRIPTEVHSILYDHIHLDPILQYWERRRPDLQERVHWAIDWTAAGQAMHSLSSRKQIWLYKHLTGHCAIGTVMVRRGERTHSECPRCGRPDEDTTHVVTCRHQDAVAIWRRHLAHLREWLLRSLSGEHHYSGSPHVALQFQFVGCS